jgi:SAM-dependent methyltransferase
MLDAGTPAENEVLLICRVAARLRDVGLDAWIIDPSKNPASEAGRDLIAEMTDLPFADGSFDLVIERGLCRLPRVEVARAVRELRRVARRGLVLGSVTIDLPIDLIERFDLINGVKTLTSRWDWSEMMFASGFEHALTDPARLARAWKRAEEAGAGPGHWYQDADALHYSFYQVSEAAAPWPDVGRERGEIREPVHPQKAPVAMTVISS